MILVSSCLAGYKCAYDGNAKTTDEIVELVKMGKAIPVCPEQLGGLATPRTPSECVMVNDEIRVISKKGEDLTDEFVKGAKETLSIANLYDCKYAILKKYSPSCGARTYDGSFTGALSDMSGITANLLMENGIEVISSNDEENVKKLILQLKQEKIEV